MKLYKLFLLGTLINVTNINVAQNTFAQAKTFYIKEKLNTDYCF
jgi:hypothetical protein